MAHSAVVDTRRPSELAVVEPVADTVFAARKRSFVAGPAVGQSFVDCLKSFDSA